MRLVDLCPKVTSAVAVLRRSLRFRGLSGTPTVMDSGFGMFEFGSLSDNLLSYGALSITKTLLGDRFFYLSICIN